MLKNYLTVAVRNLLKYRVYSFINLSGLAVGMACSILILLWIRHEVSYDTFHKRADDIYRVYIKANIGGEKEATFTPFPLVNAIRETVPEAEYVTHVMPFGKILLNYKGERIFEQEDGLSADPDFLRMFDFELLKGDRETALDDPYSILLTQVAAKKFFGDENPVGKTLKADNDYDLTVTGVLAEVPTNSHFDFDFIVPQELERHRQGTEQFDEQENWYNFNYMTYLCTKPGADPAVFQPKIDALYEEYRADIPAHFYVQPLEDAYLNSSHFYQIESMSQRLGSASSVRNFSIIAGLILLIACFNFMNLATARASLRAREIGLRKVVGAYRSQLITQLLAESVLMALLSLAIGLVLVVLALPAFNSIMDSAIPLGSLFGDFTLALVGVALLTGLVAGSYPAFFLSSFEPATTLKGSYKAGNAGALFRKTLVVTQFSLSIALIIGATMVYKQLAFINSQDLGFDKQNVLYIDSNGELGRKYEQVKELLKAEPSIVNVSAATSPPIDPNSYTIDVQWEDKPEDDRTGFYNFNFDEDYLETVGMELVAGRGFDDSRASDTAAVVLNEAAIAVMGMASPQEAIDKVIGYDGKRRVIGVVKDFHIRPLNERVEPFAALKFKRSETWKPYAGTYMVRTAEGQTDAAIAAMERVCKEVNPDFPFNYYFLDRKLGERYAQSERLSGMFNFFAVLAVFISCLGLFGLVSFTAERRTKEIGIRKVLGASASSIFGLLTKEFIALLAIGAALGGAAGYYSIWQWLETFTYRTELSYWVLPMALAMLVAIALATVGYRAVRAAGMNPSKALRYE